MSQQGEHHRVVIVGAGFAGVGLGVRLREAGIDDFVIVERNPRLGGTWFEHTYPGCQCDVPTHLYSYSFARNPDWTRLYPLQEEILDYIQRVSDHHGVTGHIRLSTAMERAEWDEEATVWRLRTSGGELTCQILVSAIGGFAEPLDPAIEGWESFAGTRWHSARWNHDHDLRGERVAVIGTGCAAAQFVPRIQPNVGRLFVFQRTPGWVMPHLDRALSPRERAVYRRVPAAQDLQRNLQFAMYEAIGVGFRGRTRMIEPLERIGRAHLARQVHDPELREKLTPRYRFGCKRPILSNDFYPALTRANVELITDSIERVEERATITADGLRREVDTIIAATGYRYNRSRTVDRVRGVGDLSLGRVWDGSPRAYLGSTVPGFPNMFILLGPNAIGINSVIYTLESQINYVMSAVGTMGRLGVRRMEVRPGELERFVEEMDRRSTGSVWTEGGCTAYYTDDDGRNYAIYPGFAAEFRRRTKRFDADAYKLAA